MTMNNPKPSTDRAELLMQKLWEIDPMRTSCNVNPDMETEYWSQARDIIDQRPRAIHAHLIPVTVGNRQTA